MNTNDRDQEDGALCIEWRNTEIRKNCTLYHIYGNNEVAVLCMIQRCYGLWKSDIYDKNTEETIHLFVNCQVVNKNDKLKWLFQDSDQVYITEKNNHCDDSNVDVDIEKDKLLQHEQ